MKKILILLFIAIFLQSCASIYGPNPEKRTQHLSLGMTKKEALSVMGKDYYIESSSQVMEGNMEVLHFRSLYFSEYLLYFLNGHLTEFHRYIKPTPYQQNTIESDNSL